GALLLGAGLDGRVGLLQPHSHLLGVLVPGVPARPLGGEVPAPEVVAHRPVRQVDVALLADEVPDGAATPQRRRDAQFLGLVRSQQALYDFGLGVANTTSQLLPGSRSIISYDNSVPAWRWRDDRGRPASPRTGLG